MLRLLGGIRPGRTQVGAAAKVNAAHFFDRERMHMGRATFHQPLEPVEKAQHLGTSEDAADRHGTNHAVDARRWPSSDKHAHNGSLTTGHLLTPVMLLEMRRHHAGLEVESVASFVMEYHLPLEDLNFALYGFGAEQQ